MPASETMQVKMLMNQGLRARGLRPFEPVSDILSMMSSRSSSSSSSSLAGVLVETGVAGGDSAEDSRGDLSIDPFWELEGRQLKLLERRLRAEDGRRSALVRLWLSRLFLEEVVDCP